MNTVDLLRRIELVRPQAGSLIQTILEAGVAGESVPLGVVNEDGSAMLSLRTIVRAMEVLDDFSKTKDFFSTADSRTIHAYYVVESAVSGQWVVPGSHGALRAGEPESGVATRDVPSGVHGDPDDNRSGD